MSTTATRPAEDRRRRPAEGWHEAAEASRRTVLERPSNAARRRRWCLTATTDGGRRVPFGSGLHLGSSVTFRNTFGQCPGTQFNVPPAENHELFVDNSSGPRRSCSITLAYPSDSVILTMSDNPDGLSKQSTAAMEQSSSTANRLEFPVLPI